MDAVCAQAVEGIRCPPKETELQVVRVLGIESQQILEEQPVSLTAEPSVQSILQFRRPLN